MRDQDFARAKSEAARRRLAPTETSHRPPIAGPLPGSGAIIRTVAAGGQGGPP